jgi:predicted dehydrogenase
MRYQWWRWFWDFCEGTMTDLFTHVVDVAHWFLGKDQPLSATAMGMNPLIPSWQTPDTVERIVRISWRLADRVQLHDGRLARGRRDAVPRH